MVVLWFLMLLDQSRVAVGRSQFDGLLFGESPCCKGVSEYTFCITNQDSFHKIYVGTRTVLSRILFSKCRTVCDNTKT